ncbi:M15 family metallopeptidase [Candidatus Saccharibacteria bacterium]|nr:M15 family metallopeptidase [Candidatus Saccharibacteria bacterium]
MKNARTLAAHWWPVLATILLIIGGFIALLLLTQPSPQPARRDAAQEPQKQAIADTPSSPDGEAPSAPKPPTFNKLRHSTATAGSLWVVANKQHPLNPKDYAPKEVATVQGVSVAVVARDDLQALLAAAAKDGHTLKLISGYRSHGQQHTLHEDYAREYGREATETFSARPGYSEHQTGLTVDFGTTSGDCHLNACFGGTPEGKWLAEHSYEYGFILRYLEGKEAITGYEPESWHFRYVGRELAAEIHARGYPTLEEFFGISGGTSY